MDMQVRLFDLVMMFSRALDMISSVITHHHADVGYLVSELSRRVGFGPEEQETVLVAALLHDVGAVPLDLHLEDLGFESASVRHDYAGSLFIRACPFLSHVADVVAAHHLLCPQARNGTMYEKLGHMICLTDRADVLLAGHRAKNPMHLAVQEVWRELSAEPATRYNPDFMQALGDLLHDPHFVEGLKTPRATLAQDSFNVQSPTVLDMHRIIQFSSLFALALDARSRFTATHSSGVAAVARALAQCAGYDSTHAQKIYLAGFLHDIGKLGVPNSLIEKPGKLTPEEYALVREHAANSLLVLDKVPGLDPVGLWGALHHERVDGHGYPLGLKRAELPQEARLMAVADVFTAITENRPYRMGMDQNTACSLLRKMTAEGALDEDFTGLLLDNYARVDAARAEMQQQSLAQLIRIRCDMDSKAKIS